MEKWNFPIFHFEIETWLSADLLIKYWENYLNCQDLPDPPPRPNGHFRFHTNHEIILKHRMITLLLFHASQTEVHIPIQSDIMSDFIDFIQL